MPQKKGQQEVLTSILITAILIGIISAVLFWGLPLIQKSKDASVLDSSEEFMKALNNKIKFVANNGGKDRLVINVPGTVRFLPDDIAGPTIQLAVDSQGTLYATNAEIPLGRNECSRTEGVWAINDPEVLCLTSQQIDSNKYLTTYRLSHILLKTESIISYRLVMTGQEAVAGQGHTLIFENSGTIENGTLISTLVSINIL